MLSELKTITRKVVHTARELPGLVIGTELRYSIYRELVRTLHGQGDDPDVVRPLLLALEREGRSLSQYDALSYLLERHPRPHTVNWQMCMEEVRHGIDDVRSYPPYVWLDISSICTVECRFCKYTHRHLPKEIVGLEQIKAIEWFPYVRMLNLTAGTAEALSNPHFGEIFDYLRDTYPHLHLSFLTNGRTLNERALRRVAGRLDHLHVSMNASSEADYERIIANGSWRDFNRNMGLMRETFRAEARPKVSASFVMMRWNLASQLQNLEYAAAHGARQILFHHFYPHYIQDLHHEDLHTLGEKFSYQDSLYHEKEQADEVIGRLRERGRELGVEVHTPPRFGEPGHITFGVRSLIAPAPECADPWTRMYMLWGFKSRREEITICCGLAADLGVYFDRDEIASREGLLKVRNHPTLRAYRRTVNGSQVNPICKLCRESDRFDPQAVYPDQRSFFEFNGLPVPPNLSGDGAGSGPCAP